MSSVEIDKEEKEEEEEKWDLSTVVVSDSWLVLWRVVLSVEVCWSTRVDKNEAVEGMIEETGSVTWADDCSCEVEEGKTEVVNSETVVVA